MAKRKSAERKRIDDQLRAALKAHEGTLYAVAKAADVAPEQLYRFMSGKRDLRFATAASLADVLELELKPRKDTW